MAPLLLLWNVLWLAAKRITPWCWPIRNPAKANHNLYARRVFLVPLAPHSHLIGSLRMNCLCLLLLIRLIKNPTKAKVKLKYTLLKTGPVAKVKSTEKRFKYDSFLSSGKSWYRNECPSGDSADNLCQYLWGPHVRLKNFSRLGWKCCKSWRRLWYQLQCHACMSQRDNCNR